MTGLECGLKDLAALASIPYRSHHQRMSERSDRRSTSSEAGSRSSERASERASVQSFLLEETEEAGRGENDAIGMAASTEREDNGHPNSRD